MSWTQHQSGLILPDESPLSPIHLFIDETFTADRSGFLQACFPVPQNIYEEVIVPQSRELLRQFGLQATEFKGAAIKPGNIRPYRDFLHLFTGISAHISDQAPLYPIVSLDGIDAYAGQQFECVRSNVEGSLQNLNASDATHIVAEFSRQMLWLHRHLPTIAPQGFGNGLNCTFDAKYLHAEQMRESRFFSGGQLVTAAMSSLETVLTSCARTLLSYERSVLRLPMIGRIKRFRFVRSPDEFGLQAADVLSHLIYSALRQAVGIVDANTDFKVHLLSEVMPDFAIDDELRSRLTVITANDSRPDIGLTDRLMRSRFQIAPDDADAPVQGSPETPSTPPESASAADGR